MGRVVCGIRSVALCVRPVDMIYPASRSLNIYKGFETPCKHFLFQNDVIVMYLLMSFELSHKECLWRNACLLRQLIMQLNSEWSVQAVGCPMVVLPRTQPLVCLLLFSSVEAEWTKPASILKTKPFFPHQLSLSPFHCAIRLCCFLGTSITVPIFRCLEWNLVDRLNVSMLSVHCLTVVIYCAITKHGKGLNVHYVVGNRYAYVCDSSS